MSKTINTILASSLVLLTGCIDLDDDEDSTTQETEQTGLVYDRVNITSANATSVSQLAIDWVVSGDSGDSGLLSNPLATGVITTAKTSSDKLPGKEWLDGIITTVSQQQDSVTGIIETDDCEDGGTITYESSAQDLLSGNGKITITHDQCNEYGEIIHGTIISTFESEGDQNSDTFSSKMSFVAQGYTTTDSYGTLTINGDYMFEMDVTATNETSVLSVGRLTMEMDSDIQELKNFMSKEVYTFNSDVLTIDVEGEIIGSSTGGSITIDTTTAFQFNGEFAETPISGSMKVTGKSGSNVVITALSEDNVQLAMDYDGDNVADETKTVTWQSLGY